MAFNVEDLIAGLHRSRDHFMKHLNGVRDDQWDWKPYAECKSIRETLVHLIVDYRAALEALETNAEPNYEALMGSETSGEVAGLLTKMESAHNALCEYIGITFQSSEMGQIVSAFGAPMKLAAAIPAISSEDYYHAGQVAFIRLATDPGWDYYAAIYGGE